MYRPSDTNLHNWFADKTRRKDFFAIGNGTLISSADGDISTEGGVVITRSMCREEDITFGDVVPQTASINLVNWTGAVDGGHDLGEEYKFALGVQTAESASSTPSGTYFSFTDVGNHSFTSNSNGFYIDNSRKYTSSQAKFTSCYVHENARNNGVRDVMFLYDSLHDRYWMMWVDNGTIIDYDDDFAVSKSVARRLQESGRVDQFQISAWASGGEVSYKRTSGGYIRTYRLVPAGIFYLPKPAYNQGEVISIDCTDIYNKWTISGDGLGNHNIDDNASPLLARMADTGSCEDFIRGLLGPDAIVPSIDSSVTFQKTIWDNEQWSIREIVSRCAERMGIIYTTDIYGGFNFISPSAKKSTGVVKSYGAGDILRDGLVIYEMYVNPPVKVVNYYSRENTFESSNGYSGTIATIQGNPVINDQATTDTLLSRYYAAFSQYTPMDFTVVDTDPSVEVGDIVSVTVYGKTYQVPALAQDITFNGRIDITYHVTGNKERSSALTDAYAMTDIANRVGDVTERVTEIENRTIYKVGPESVANPQSGWGNGSSTSVPKGKYIIIATAANGGNYAYLKGRIGINVNGTRVIHSDYYFNGADANTAMECVYAAEFLSATTLQATVWVPETAGTWNVTLLAMQV